MDYTWHLKAQQKEKQFRVQIYDPHIPDYWNRLIAKQALPCIAECWQLAASVRLVVTPAVETSILPLSLIASGRIWETNPNLHFWTSPCCLSHPVSSLQSDPATTAGHPGTVYYINLVLRKHMAKTLHVLIKKGHKVCVSSSCKVNPVSLSRQIVRLCHAPVSPATACGFNDNKEIQQLGRCKREPRAQEYSLSDPHSRPHQSQSVSPSGNVPMCSRHGGRRGLTGG